MAAYQRIMCNKGAAGVEGMPVEDLKPWLMLRWPTLRAALLDGSYIPSAIRKLEIPKPNGGVRTLGIPTVLDRLIQQALLQILQPIFEPGFSDSSFGFRPGRNAWQAVQTAKPYIVEGRRWVVDLDLAQFFDRVSHDILMSRLTRRIEDERILKLITTILLLTPVLRGWVSYYRLTEVRGVLEDLDGWIRRKLRGILWRQWKRPFTRARMLQSKGLAEERAWRSATNQRGPWWNAGASHMNEAFPKRWFDLLGLVSLQDTLRRFQRVQ
ncbi:reverse transcriptase domain-containing protein [Paludibacterium yongneupense]|uniref:reverse transcriptase domain-containing protein n=1 Tax=Paludibacterium yongneupense TaxID=400061 RepID=UPI00041DF6C4|nr:reverse transcriptase domain-containing protein [Paludibacterium yongneupense]